MVRWIAIALLTGIPAAALVPVLSIADEPTEAPAAAPTAAPVAPDPQQEGQPQSQSVPQPEAQAPETRKRPSAPPKGKRYREKEAEGSEAPDRFEAHTVIKSKYTLNGKPLEVDPD